jgi:hypothetical protein
MRSSHLHRIAADIGVYLYVGMDFIHDTIVDWITSYGDLNYNQGMVDDVLNTVMQYPSDLEELLLQEWADAAVVEFVPGDAVYGTVDYEGVETELDVTEVAEMERIVEDWVIPYIDQAVDVADTQDLVYIPVESSNVEAFAYDPANRFLYVKFLPSGTGDFANGSEYVYYDVGPEIYESFLAAPSKGSFVWQVLRNPSYAIEYARIAKFVYEE